MRGTALTRQARWCWLLISLAGCSPSIDLPRDLELKLDNDAQAEREPPAGTMVRVARLDRTDTVVDSGSDLRYLDTGAILITDPRGGRVVEVDVEAGSAREWSSDGLHYPSDLAVADGNVYVRTEQQIHTLSMDGELGRHTNLFHATSDLEIDAHRGSLFATSPTYRGRELGLPLVALVDQSGALAAQFGERITQEAQFGIDDDVFFAFGAHALAVAFRRHPIIRYYQSSPPYALLGEAQVSHPTFPPLLELTNDTTYVYPRDGVVYWPTFIGGVAALREGFVVLLDLPTPELVVLDQHLHETRRLQVPLPDARARRYFGFDLLEGTGGPLRLAIGLADLDQTILVVEVTIAEPSLGLPESASDALEASDQ